MSSATARNKDVAWVVGGAIPIIGWLASKEPLWDIVSILCALALMIVSLTAVGVRAWQRKKVWAPLLTGLLCVLTLVFIRQAVASERGVLQIAVSQFDCENVADIVGGKRAMRRKWTPISGGRYEGVPESRVESVVLYMHRFHDNYLVEGDHVLGESLERSVDCPSR